MIVFGGAGPGRTNDTWILTGATGHPSELPLLTAAAASCRRSC